MEAAAIDLAVGVGTEVANSALAKIKKHVEYIYNYHDNLNALQEADGLLVAKISDESKFSSETGRSVRDVSATIVNWRSKSKELNQEAAKLIPRNKISRLKPWSRYSTSKQASELTPKIKENVDNAPDFGTSFDRPTTEGARFNVKNYMEFGSRLTIQNEVLEALRKDDVSMCSICGMGGMGKTMMAKKVIEIVEADRLFDKVAMVTVTQNPNLEEIQKEIVDTLQLKIEEKMSMQGRAKKLNDWLSNNKTLLVLDDVWRKLPDEDFEKIGIPLGAKRCKILITSRELDECIKMRSSPNIPLKILEKKEDWNLFVQIVGERVEDTARKIVAECNGLPFAIVTIAGALIGKPEGAWDDSLTKLQKSNLPGIPDMEKVYLKIQVSYDLLNDPEAQSCLLLCCLFPEDYNVPVEKLVFYGWGLELFEGVDSLKEARNRVDSIVHKLKSSFLLLNGEKEGFVKLHDIVRDFAIWFSSKDERPYLVRCEKEMTKWPEKQPYEKCHAISFVCQKIKNHLIGLRCPNLKLLQLHFEDGSDELPNGVFDGMEELGVVDLQVPLKIAPFTTQKDLRTLLITCDWRQRVPLYYFREMLGEGGMKNLEIFSLSSMRLSGIPMEIGFMSNLRCLRFCGVSSFDYMPPGVLPNLVKLEELELPYDFRDWGLEERGGSRVNASLSEIASLPLTSITIGLRRRSILGENTFKSVTKFRVFVEFYDPYVANFDANVLVVREVDACDVLVKWTSSLLRQCHRLELSSVDLKYIMSQQLRGNNFYPCAYFSRLETLMIRRMGSLEEILHGPYLSNRQQPCFSSLTQIEIQECRKLKRAFPVSVAREFTQLHSMKLFACSKMEEVFYEDLVDNGNQAETSKGKQRKHIPTRQNIEELMEQVGEREVDHVVLLPRLKLLYISWTPKLRVVCDENHTIDCPSLEELTIEECGSMEALSYGLFNAPGTKKLVLIGVRHLKNILKLLLLEQDNRILQLKKLKILKCNEMKYLADAVEGPVLLKNFFSCLEELIIEDMHSLEEVWHGPYFSKIHSQSFSNLTETSIKNCPKIKHLFPLSVATELRQLKVMKIESCEEIEEIFFNDQLEDGNQVKSSVELNAATIETATTTTLANPNSDEKSSFICPTSFLQCILPKGKQPKHPPSHQMNTEETTAKLVDKEVDDATIDAIIFPQLKSMLLYKLSKLRIFYDGNHAMELPSLVDLRIDECYGIEALSNGSFKAPNLEDIEINSIFYPCGEDLNETVKKKGNIVEEEDDDDEDAEDDEEEDDDDEDAEDDEEEDDDDEEAEDDEDEDEDEDEDCEDNDDDEDRECEDDVKRH